MGLGYMGKILHVDLTNGTWEIETPPEEFYRKYMGGSAMGMYYILRDMPPGVDALAPENVLTLFTGVPAGAPISGLSRIMVNAKSPLTNAIGDSQAGGFFPAELKFAGFDGIVIKGKAPKPVYLYIRDGEVELRDAAHLWGKVTGEVEAELKQELGDKKIHVLQCGPAGERLVRCACLLNYANRANGRTGMGAVMGAKNLRAIAVRGTHKPEFADKASVSAMAKLGKKLLSENGDVSFMTEHGTGGTIAFQHEVGGLPTRNFREGCFAENMAIDGTTLTEKYLKENDTCYACIVRCKRVVEINEGPYKVDPVYGGPEYETLSALGSYCCIDDLAAICKANEICNKYGVDTISAGGIIAFAMDCYENGVISQEQTGGIDLRFGNAKAMLAALKQLVLKEGVLGAVLGEGSERAAQIWGNGAAEHLTTVKGQEAPAHMPRVKRAMGLIYAVNPFGADHQSAEHDPYYEEGTGGWYMRNLQQLDLKEPQPQYSLTPEKVRLAVFSERFYSMMDTVGLCQFVFGSSWCVYGPDHAVEVVKATTGWDVSLFELMLVGERRLNMMLTQSVRCPALRKVTGT